MPWQRHVCDVAFELDDDGRFIYEEVNLTVPRQSGKTTLVVAKTAHRLVKMPQSHQRQRSVYTAQTRAKARDKLERDFAELLRAAFPVFREITSTRARPKRPVEWKISLNNGSENIQFGRGNYWLIDAPTEGAGHGDTIDDFTIDEAFAHQDDSVEGGMAPAMATRRDRHGWILSTAGNEKSFYLYRKVLAGRAACEAGEHGRIAYFEWSAPDDADPADPETWRLCSPALGITIDERFLETEWAKAQRKGQEGIDTFRRSYLNQWPNPPVLADQEEHWVIPKESWLEAGSDTAELVGTPAFALEVAEDRSWSAFAAAGASNLGPLTHVDLIAYEPGTWWVPARAKDLVKKWGGKIAVRKGSPAASLVGDLEREGLDVVEYGTEEHARACGKFYDAVGSMEVVHCEQPALTTAVRGAVQKTHNDAWVWAPRRSTLDISPVVAVTLAHWLYISNPRTEAYSAPVQPTPADDDFWRPSSRLQI